MNRTHYGQHSSECFACHLQSLSFQTGEPPSHVKNGNPWKDNPVVERIQELSGQEINTDIPRAPGA